MMMQHPPATMVPMQDPLGGSRLQVPTVPMMHPPAGYVQQPMGGAVQPQPMQMSVARVPAPRMMVLPGGMTGPAGHSYVAPPRIANQQPQQGVVVAPTAYAPGMTFRPSFVAAAPLPAAVSSTAPGVGMPTVQASGAMPTGAVPTGGPQVLTYAASVGAVAPGTTGMSVAPGVPIPVPSAARSAPVVNQAPATGVNMTTSTSELKTDVKPAKSASADYVAVLEKRIADLEILHASKNHSAFVFIKPHAVTDSVKEVVRAHLVSRGIFIVEEGEIQAEEIDSKKFIDTHYGAIAAKAVTLKPSELTVQERARDAFKVTFDMSWPEALEQGLVFNAMDGVEALGITPEELAAKWSELKKDVDLLKFGGGFYCGKVENVFIINGFYLDMRGKFTQPGKSIYYFVTEWDARAVPWSDFRGRILGATDPAVAELDSLRSMIYQNWEGLGLQACPDTGDNGVHASASPFEALAERVNWLGASIDGDFFGRALLASGLPLSTIQEWCFDPTVTFEDQKQSLFDLLEDLSARDCLAKAAAIAQEN